jgi:hypothetical protein
MLSCTRTARRARVSGCVGPLKLISREEGAAGRLPEPAPWLAVIRVSMSPIDDDSSKGGRRHPRRIRREARPGLTRDRAGDVER